MLHARLRHRFSIPSGVAGTNLRKTARYAGENRDPLQLTKALLEWALNAELTHHLGYEKHERVAEKGETARNGSEKTLETEQGEMVV